MADHRTKALSLLKQSRQLRAASYDPDAAGSEIRAGWAKQADALLAESHVEALLAGPTSEGRTAFFKKVSIERGRQIGKGYTAEQDDKSGVDHLLMEATEYAYRGEPVKSAALIEAAREALGRRYGIPLRPLVEEVEEIPDDLSYEEQYSERP